MSWAHSAANDVLLEALEVIQTNQGVKEFLDTDPVNRANYRDESQRAMTAGTIAHAYIQEWISAAPQIRPTMLENYSTKRIMVTQSVSRDIALASHNSIHSFEQWVTHNRFNPTHTEVPLLSRKHLFGGTLDCIGTLGGTRILFDWKTSKRVYADYLCQLAAYVLLWTENHPLKPIHCCHLLRFDKETGDFTDHQFTNLHDAKECFLHFRACYDLMNNLNRRLN